MIKKYEEDFNRKIDCFIHHPSYNELRKQADTALRFHTGCGIEAIKAQDFMDSLLEEDRNKVTLIKADMSSEG